MKLTKEFIQAAGGVVEMREATFMKKRAAEIIARSMCNSYTIEIDADTLVRIFRKEEPIEKWARLLSEEFFDSWSCPFPYLKAFMEENNFSLADITDIFFSLPDFLQTNSFKMALSDGIFE